MKLVCPGCGATASFEAWDNDVAIRQTIAALAELPGDLPVATLRYLGLFRPAKRALSWKKALKLVREVLAVTTTSHIQIQGHVARPCAPRIWSQAMEDMVNRSDQLRRPMKNHNYLKQVAYDLADKEDAASEATGRSLEPQGGRRAVQPEFEPEAVDPATMSPMDQYIQCLREDRPSQEEIDAWNQERINHAN